MGDLGITNMLSKNKVCVLTGLWSLLENNKCKNNIRGDILARKDNSSHLWKELIFEQE